MTLLTIAQEVSRYCGIPSPDAVIGSTDREMQELLAFINDTGIEIARRVEWGEIEKEAIVYGVGSAVALDLPGDFDRLTSGVSVRYNNLIVRPLTRSEWNMLTPIMVENTPRYYLVENDSIRLFPYLEDGDQIKVNYLSKWWVGGTAATFSTDGDSPVFDEKMIVIGTVARWKRQKGQDYQEYEAEYEAILSQRANFDNGRRF